MDNALSFTQRFELISSSQVDVSFLLSIKKHGTSLESGCRHFLVHTVAVWQPRLAVWRSSVWCFAFIYQRLVELVIIHFSLHLILGGRYRCFTELFSRWKIVFRLHNVLDTSEIDENSILIGVRAHAVEFSCWVNQAIILAFISLCDFQEDDGSFLNESVDDERRPNNNENWGEWQAKMTFSSGDVAIRIAAKEFQTRLCVVAFYRSHFFCCCFDLPLVAQCQPCSSAILGLFWGTRNNLVGSWGHAILTCG